MNNLFLNQHPSSDPWFEWLTQRRQGGKHLNSAQIRELERYRDRVLDGAALAEGMTLVDMGAGDGLIALGAIDRIGPSLNVIFADISVPLLRRAEEIALQRGVLAQCSFVEGPAEKGSGITTGCADAVTSRSTLVYVADKPTAVAEFHRILKPGGRVSIAEPIHRDTALRLMKSASQLDFQSQDWRTWDQRLLWKWSAAQFPSTLEEIDRNPITNFSEHDLFTIFERTGFTDIHLELHIDIRKQESNSWESFLESSIRPSAPTLREILSTQFTEEERRQFEAIQRPLIETGSAVYRAVMAYLTATKPKGRS